MNLTKLTEAQKTGLSSEDQVLIEAGIIGSNLELIYRQPFLNWLLQVNKKAFALHMAKLVKEAKAEAKANLVNATE